MNKLKNSAVLCATTALFVCLAWGQEHKPLTNKDVVGMVKEGLNSSVIVKAIQANESDFDVSPPALTQLKADGVGQDVMEAMLDAQSHKKGVALATASGGAAPNAAPGPSDANAGKHLLKEGMDVPLKFASDLSSKTANEGDPVEMTLDSDIKVDDVVVIKHGARAVAIVTNAKKSGMMGRAGELNIQLQHLVAGDSRVRVRGTKGRQGDSKTGTAVALTVLFGPIGLIKHGKNVEVKAGTPLAAYVDQDIWLAPAN
jgi:hypothetical protein